jgi:hypothetical protein
VNRGRRRMEISRRERKEYDEKDEKVYEGLRIFDV